MEFLLQEESSEYVKVCRFCLVLDAKMFYLQNNPLETYFEHVFGICVTSTLHLPPFLCYECAGLVRKFYLFKERCNRGQSALYDIFQSNGKFTADEIKKVDRTSLQLTSNLSVCNINAEVDFSVDHNRTDDRLVKEEPNIDDSNNGMEVTVDIGSIKEEDDPEFSQLAADFPPSSDDEPLSIHKTFKEKKKGKKRGRKRKDVSGLEQDADITKELSELSGTEPAPRKRGRPRKTGEAKPIPQTPLLRRTKNTGGVHCNDDVTLEDYVTIVTLTLEEQLEEITQRKTSSNYLNAAFQCHLCFKGFIDTNAWKHHQGKHDPSAGDVECAVCKFRFQTRRALQKHAVNHEKKYACKSCSYVSKTTTQAKQHQRWHKGVTYSCEYCDEVSTKWTSYLSHVRIKHPSQHICGVCGYSFVSQLGLTMHKTMMHKDVQENPVKPEEPPGPYCEKCDVKFISSEAYNRHMVTSVKHAESNNFSKGCRVCGATFNNPEELRIHHRKEHARSRPKNYGKKKNIGKWPAECVHCGDMIENAREQWTHFRRAHPDKAYPIQKNYVCDICGKSFRGNAFLIYHKRTHSTERAYKCTMCDKAFYNRTNLNMHARTHSECRPYPCEVCCKAFKCKGALDRHYRSHTGVKPYECEVCGKAFGQSNSRKLHVRTVHLKQPAPYTHRARRDTKLEPKEHPPALPFYQ